MSQVLRRLKSVTEAGGAGTPNRKYSIYSLLSQYCSEDRNGSTSNGRVTTTQTPSLSRRKLFEQRYRNQQVSSYHTGTGTRTRTYGVGVDVNNGAITRMTILSGGVEQRLWYQSRRSMSFISNLMKRKKKESDEDDDHVKDEEGGTVVDTRTLPLSPDMPKQLTEEEIEAKRNISRLRPYHQLMVQGKMPWDLKEPVLWFHHTVKFKQRMFGKYGESSGVNPGICWPTHEDLKKRLEYEAVAYPFTIQEMVENKRILRQKQKEERDRR